MRQIHCEKTKRNPDTRPGKQAAVLYSVLIALALVYMFFAVARPFEVDESHHILSGIGALEGEFNPFIEFSIGHFDNPFRYTMGSMLIPIVFGAAYIAGGILLPRLLGMAAVLASLWITSLIIRKREGNFIIPLLFLGFSSSTIMLASDALLDSFALLFLMLSLYFMDAEKPMHSGLFAAMAAITKYVLLPAAFLLLLYVLFRGDAKGKGKFVAGMASIFAAFIAAYWQLLPGVLDFIMEAKVADATYHNPGLFLSGFISLMPILTITSIALLVARRADKKLLYFFLPMAAVLAYHFLSMDYVALPRHLLYSEFPAAIIVGEYLGKAKPRIRPAFAYAVVSLVIIAYAGISMMNAIGLVENYGSYNAMAGELERVDGKVVAMNMKSFLLAKGLPINETAYNAFSYDWFDYDGDWLSKPIDYDSALKDGFFDFALISSRPNPSFGMYNEIESYVRARYCKVYDGASSSGIDIYKRCAA